MANFTLELRQLQDSKTFKLFDFDYAFYNVSHKAEFERKFMERYFFNEIGFETVARFKQRLCQKLNSINRYYEQLYQTEIAGKDINYLLNKDLIETFEREVDDVGKGDTTSVQTTSNQSDFKESSIENGNSDLNLNSGSLTTVNQDKGTNSSNSTNTNTNENKTNEKTILTSKGNIGVTSGGQLMEDWRKIIINIDELILDECRDLFLLIY